MCWYDFKVFWTSKEKGWGIRTLEDLPASAFVFEFINEVFTNAELMQWIQGCMRNGECAYPYAMHLDANWAFEIIVSDDQALCLDRQYFGNISRFLNHWCKDASLIDMPTKTYNQITWYYQITSIEPLVMSYVG